MLYMYVCHIWTNHWRKTSEDACKDWLISDLSLICPLSQDLLKYTPHHHHDRSSLQTALTDLENVTHMLNERKRESEELFQSKKLQKMLNFKIPGEKQCRLVRQDDMEEVVRFWFLIDALNF